MIKKKLVSCDGSEFNNIGWMDIYSADGQCSVMLDKADCSPTMLQTLQNNFTRISS